MRAPIRLLCCLSLAALLTPVRPFGSASAAQASIIPSATSGPAPAFDPKRDASEDIQVAIAEAQRTHKRILLYVGGDWCVYCAELKALFQAHPDLADLRNQRFVTVHVFYDHENHNSKALAPYGQFVGIPHFFVLDSNGRLLHSEHLVDLRENGRYDAARMRAFLELWAAHP
ncbi:MAG TPA: thioredoxin family protein [Terracidiphilus sp.]|nr:thioredoxin family protein [Terracidiphilus sp.]